MGLNFCGSSSSYDSGNSPNNPDPTKYEILWKKQIGNYCVISVRYFGCTNYEGTKILVYKALLENVLAQKSLDPHFSESKKFLSPIARFVPTYEGMGMAQAFCQMLMEVK